ncbi:MAG TPA: ABC transporter permease, partial [Candidatus Binatia bacterium]|nr:ABC transporter permease [Candidatus Binatia bacterium]
ATQAHVVSAVLRQTLPPTLAGIGVGMGGALALDAVLKTLVLGAERFDLMAFAVPSAILALVAVVATLGPLARALGVDPVTALRTE